MRVRVDQFASVPGIVIPGTLATPVVAPVYGDGIPAASVSLPGSSVTSPGRATVAQKFWSSVPRPGGDLNEENLVITLSKADYINYIHLEIPHFPHQAQIFWMDSSGKWQPVRLPSGAVLSYTVSGSVPAVVSNAAALSLGLNPYHYGAGHWLPHDDMIQPVSTAQLLIVLTRENSLPGSGTFPVDPSGHLAPYPLGIRNVDFGYRARTSTDIPWTPRSAAVVTERASFATATDLRGSPVQIAVRENRASELLAGTGGLQPWGPVPGPYPWRRAPNPSSESVVNLYVDARDPNGNPQVIDRFYIVPVTSGVNCNLYYSSRPPPARPFQAVDTPLQWPLVTVSGTTLPAADSEGIVFAAAPGWLTLGSQGPGLSSPWWQGIEIMPQFGPADSGEYIIFDNGGFQLYFQAGTWNVLAGGWLPAAWRIPFA